MKINKIVRNFAVCTIALFFLFIFLKGIVYYLPEDRIKNNVRISAEYLQDEGVYPYTYAAPEYNLYSQRADNYTDAVFLNVSYNMNEHNMLEAIAGDYFGSASGENEVEILKNFIDSPEKNLRSYSRQWFGSLVWIRFLLVFFDIQKIRVLNQYLFYILLAYATILLCKKINSTVAMIFAGSMAVLSIDVVAASINLMGSFFCILFGIIAFCKLYPNKISKYMLMYIIGAITAFFDLFSLPFVTFVMAVFILVFDYENGNIRNFKEGILEIIKMGLVWLCGYIVLWMSKWAFASVVQGTNVFKDAIIEMHKQSISKNTITWGPDTTWGYITDSIRLCFENMFPINYIVMLGHAIGKKTVTILVIVFLIALILYWMKNKLSTKQLWFSGLLLIVACFPYVCYFVMHTHAYIHFWMWFRLQLITWISILNAYMYSMKKK